MKHDMEPSETYHTSRERPEIPIIRTVSSTPTLVDIGTSSARLFHSMSQSSHRDRVAPQSGSDATDVEHHADINSIWNFDHAETLEARRRDDDAAIAELRKFAPTLTIGFAVSPGRGSKHVEDSVKDRETLRVLLAGGVEGEVASRV